MQGLACLRARPLTAGPKGREVERATVVVQQMGEKLMVLSGALWSLEMALKNVRDATTPEARAKATRELDMLLIAAGA